MQTVIFFEIKIFISITNYICINSQNNRMYYFSWIYIITLIIVIIQVKSFFVYLIFFLFQQFFVCIKRTHAYLHVIYVYFATLQTVTNSKFSIAFKIIYKLPIKPLLWKLKQRAILITRCMYARINYAFTQQ